MNMKDVFGAGEEILDAVTDAAKRQDYSGLSDSIRNTVNRTAGQIRQEFSNPADRYRDVKFHNPSEDYKEGYYGRRENGQKQAGQWGYGPRQGGAGPQQGGAWQSGQSGSRSQQGEFGQSGSQTNRQPFYQYRPQNNSTTAVVTKPVGKASASAQFGLGIAGTILFGVLTVVTAVLSGVTGGSGVATAVLGIFTGYSVYNIFRGRSKLDLVSRFKRYVTCIGSRSYATVTELARYIGRDSKAVVKDLRKMIKRGMFPQGKLDEQETTLMLTSEIYDQYLEAERQKKLREEAGRKAGQEAKDREKEIDGTDYSPEVKKILKDGNDYILMVHKCNDDIPGKEMSDKLDRLEGIMKKIFDQVKRHPESAENLRKFMTYYLPTTRKLLEAYIDLDRQPETGENVRNTKREIEESLDAINEAFEQLLDDLFQDTAWDIASDISVMKTMMAQDGLRSDKERSTKD